MKTPKSRDVKKITSETVPLLVVKKEISHEITKFYSISFFTLAMWMVIRV